MIFFSRQAELGLRLILESIRHRRISGQDKTYVPELIHQVSIKFVEQQLSIAIWN